MTINEFLITLEEELKYLPKKKRLVIVNIYREKINTEIDLGTDEDKIASLFPHPSEIAKDIYEKEGIDYLERRKRKLKSDDIFKMLVCSIGMIFTISAILVLTYYSVFSVVKLITLLTKLTIIKDIIFMSLLVASLIITGFIIYLYLIDIFILIVNFLLDLILKPFNKTISFKDFSVIDKLEEIFKKEKLFKKLLIVFFITTILMALFNYTLKTYFYRSYTRVAPTNYSETIDLTKYQDALGLKIDIDEALINVKKGDKFEIKLVSEFKRTIDEIFENNTLSITTEKIQTFDLFDFLKEPTPLIDITLPKNLELHFNQDNGTIQLDNITTNYLYVKLYQGNLIIKDSLLDEAIIKTSLAGTNYVNTNIQNADIDITDGKMNVENCSWNNFTINNLLAEVNVKNFDFYRGVITATKGLINLEEIKCNSIDIESVTGSVDINNAIVDTTVNVLSSSSSDITISNTNALTTKVVAYSGDVVYFNVNADSNIETGATALVTKCSGKYDIKCLGNWLTVEQCKFTDLTVQAQTTEASFKFISADYIKYEGNNSMSTLYFVFGRIMDIQDLAGDLHFDNDLIIATSDAEKELYNEYYKKIEKLSISPNATFRVENGTTLGE